MGNDIYKIEIKNMSINQIPRNFIGIVTNTNIGIEEIVQYKGD
jgi:hypothetical protein